MSKAKAIINRFCTEDFSEATTPEELAAMLGCKEGDVVGTPDGEGEVVRFVIDDNGSGVEVKIGDQSLIYPPEDITCGGSEEGEEEGTEEPESEEEGDEIEVGSEEGGLPVA